VEFISSFFLLVIAYGVAFDPRNSKIYGPILAPLFVGGTIFILIYTTVLALENAPSGAGFNPARALGPAVACGEFSK
jgi:glycerol uptake facilitator-like aquaporin